MNKSIVEYFGNDGGHSCGYCKKDDSSLSNGMWAHQLTCQDYQDLLNRGWRRSGKYCYKPTMNKTCCPQYTIRCEVSKVKLSKSQKKVIKRLNTYLITGKKPAEPVQLENSDIIPDNQSSSSKLGGHSESVECSQNRITAGGTKSENPVSKNIQGADPNKPRCRKAKDLRKERKLSKQLKGKSDGVEANASTVAKGKNNEKNIEQLIEDLPSELAHNLEISLVAVCNNTAFDAYFEAGFELFCKYQKDVHHDPPHKLSKKRFKRFLVDGPLVPVQKGTREDIPTPGLGAFHQLYHLDGKLIAVGVLDILPNCVSSKYFFYDPEYSFLSLGTYSALREIYFIRSLQRDCAAIKYYYMGYYIHSCPKMRYKGRYDPSYLLCPEAYTWQPYPSCVPKLDANKYSRLEEDESKKPVTIDVNSTLILHQSQAMPFFIYLSMVKPRDKKEQTKEVTEYSNLAGITASSMLLYRS
ncbi:arginyl-tRNA--protein transferase 1-like isoform X3 [Hydractinia symbiolongicarpus]|uniref:arginyl-tRNA--protein transferase 1-like isoform X3 n=1 Tax=Hydractinia symbiolongicarpus TaxID=13093 RepID=UPI002550893C|nr:arginyl-tRNA--protein transferase 1-like isoform X3 [Hydractinia symbiolongicarpus]